MKQYLRIALVGVGIALTTLPGISAAQDRDPGRDSDRHRPDLRQMDQNRDGRVTVREFDAFMADHARPGGRDQGQRRDRGQPEDRAERRDDRRDQDRRDQDRRGESRRADAPPPDRAGDHRRGPPKPPRGADLDRNRDGVISAREFARFLDDMPKSPKNG